MILAGMKVPGTKDMAQRVEDELFKGWILHGNTPDVVFKNLKLNEAGEKAFASPLWSMYTKHHKEVFPDRQTSMISAFARNYEDDALATLLIAAKKVPQTEKLGYKATGPTKIFMALKLNEATDDALTSPLFNTWATYLDEFNAKFPEDKVSMIDTLRKRFDDKSIAGMLVKTKEIPTMETLTTKLQSEQVQRWLTSKKTPADILKKLDDRGDDVLSSPLLNTWAKYLEEFNAEFPRSKVSMVDTFREFFGDKALVKMLIPAKEVQSTKNIATDFESSLINTWIIAKKIPAVVRKQLGADEASAKLLTTHTTAYLILHR